MSLLKATVYYSLVTGRNESLTQTPDSLEPLELGAGI